MRETMCEKTSSDDRDCRQRDAEVSVDRARTAPTRNTHTIARSAIAAADRDHRIGQGEPELPLQVDADGQSIRRNDRASSPSSPSARRHQQPAQMGRDALSWVFTACSSGIPASSVTARSSIDRRRPPARQLCRQRGEPLGQRQARSGQRGDLARQLGRLGSAQASARTVLSVRVEHPAPPEARPRRLASTRSIHGKLTQQVDDRDEKCERVEQGSRSRRSPP